MRIEMCWGLFIAIVAGFALYLMLLVIVMGSLSDSNILYFETGSFCASGFRKAITEIFHKFRLGYWIIRVM